MAEPPKKDEPQAADAAAAQQPDEKEQKPVKVTVITELKNVIVQLSRALLQNNSQQFLKITKQIRRFKKTLRSHHLQRIWNAFYPGNKDYAFETYADYDANYDPEDVLDLKDKKLDVVDQQFQELDIYRLLLLLIYLVSKKDKDSAYALATTLVERAKQINKRHFDNLNALIYFYYARTRELNGEILEIRDELYNAYRTSCLRHDEIGQATILNLLLRNYLHFNHYEAAQHLISKSQFPDHKSNNEYCRYLYYTGRIKAVQLEYAESLSRLNQAVRKAPDTTARGFRIEVQKLACIVEMLLGDTPSRDIFAQPDLQKPLFPYYKLVQSVLKGNLLDFSHVVARYASVFIKDKLYTLIQRLHQSVIKAGLRKINLSYSRISFQDIAQKLNLPRNTDVEFIVAKSIRDGVLNGQIDHQNQYVVITEKRDLYTSTEPQQAYQKRINYCLHLHSSATKALEYPTQDFKKPQDDKNDIDPEDLLGLLEAFDFD